MGVVVQSALRLRAPRQWRSAIAEVLLVPVAVLPIPSNAWGRVSNYMFISLHCFGDVARELEVVADVAESAADLRRQAQYNG